MVNRRIGLLVATLAIVASACSSGGATTAPQSEAPAVSEAPASAAAQARVDPPPPPIARWACPGTTSSSRAGLRRTGPACRRPSTAGGGTFIDADANLSTEQQLTDVTTCINQGADVLVLLAQDDKAGPGSEGRGQGIPVIAYDRLIEDPSILYMSFNNTDVGMAEAKAMLAKVPEGNYVLIKGDPGDANAKTFLPAGWDEAGLKAAVDAGRSRSWPDHVHGRLGHHQGPEQHGSDHRQAVADGNKIDAVLAENDSTALGVAAALKGKSTAYVPVSGQDGDTANLQNVALGIQYVDVWKNANQLGKAAGAAALQLCEGTRPSPGDAPGWVIDAASAPDNLAVQDFTTPGGNTVKSMILKVQPLTQENLQMILDAKWLTKEVLCKNATDPATARTGLQVTVSDRTSSRPAPSGPPGTQGASFHDRGASS